MIARISLTIFAGTAFCVGDHATWEKDFNTYCWQNRPNLEVSYTDGSRTAFEPNAQEYRLRGELRTPHRLIDAATGAEWLSLEVTDAAGTVYGTRKAAPNSRINLYRRGPYFCEVHWLDIQAATSDGALAPLKGDLALYCYPDKLLASITWHATEDFPLARIRVIGIAPAAFEAEPLAKGEKAFFAFPLFGERPPLGTEAFDNFEAIEPMHYDAVRGCYTIGTGSTGGFQGHFYHHPNRYETARFRVTNDAVPRTIYICHETVRGNRGSVEGGVLLDAEGHPLPLTVQISKNFGGEKEEKFYNPADTPFSETYFPLILAANESREVTSLHLYQNWGRHMVKQFSSLGAWMDYFHSSTGVTETTCYVPFKFGALSGVAIADFRAMSQATFWGGQPQHDNVAGHSFLSYKTGEEWRYLAYRGTTYRSTGPNWMDIGLEYRSTDGKIRATVDTFELPQSDELRNFIHVRYEAREPVVVENARENFRLLTVASWVQSLGYTHVAATGLENTPLTFEDDHFAVRGHPLPPQNAFMAVYGEPKGSNAIVLRRWDASFGPAISLWCEKKGDTRLLLVPDADTIHLEKGDTIDFEAFWMPYGPYDSAETPRRETVAYGWAAPQIVNVKTGIGLSDFPCQVRAEDNRAEFTIQGGRDLVPVIVTGLTDYRFPRIYRREGLNWRELPHSRVGDLDGVQVFTEPEGTFGTVFLVHSDDVPQTLRVTAGEAVEPLERLGVKPLQDGSIEVDMPVPGASLRLAYPRELRIGGPDSDPIVFQPQWQESEGNSWWFEQRVKGYTVGGRITPNEDNLDLELWLGNHGNEPVSVRMPVEVRLAQMTGVRALKREGNAWMPAPVETSSESSRSLVAVTFGGLNRVLAIAWPDFETSVATAQGILTGPDLPFCPPGRRAHVYGKLYIIEGTPNDLLMRFQREVLPRKMY
ncbi:MAG: hypothetical protein U9Q79_00085 [Candidatus Hydrogenedentes bacterium]|nr:hypothetical protein [Candidatus Hydrogenedentota bacterium]